MTAHEGDSRVRPAHPDRAAAESVIRGDVPRRLEAEPRKGEAPERRLPEGRGVVRDVALKDVEPTNLGNWTHTPHGHPAAEIRKGLEALPKVEERLASGWGPEQFAELHRSGDEAGREIAKTYAAYYGDRINRIRLSETPGRPLAIDNGHYRIDLARKLGLERLPAEVLKTPSGTASEAGAERELQRRQAEAAREWRDASGAERAAFAREVGREGHKEWQATTRRLEAARGRVEGKDYAIEYELRHPDGGLVRYDYVDFKEDRIVEYKPQHLGESDFEVAKRYVDQQRRHVEAYQSRFGRTPTYEYTPYPSTVDLYREP